MILESLFGLVYVLFGILLIFSFNQLNRFLGETPSITDEVSLERFKSLARTQMYLALAGIALMALGFILGIGLIWRHGILGLLAVLIINMVILGLSQYHKKYESKARDLPASPEHYENEYRRISETWVKKALPDF